MHEKKNIRPANVLIHRIFVYFTTKYLFFDNFENDFGYPML